MNKHIIKPAKQGAVDSKYFNNFEQFNKDIHDKREKTEEFKDRLRALLLEQPGLMQQRYYNALDVLIAIKYEFDL